ncbi:MAG TPA: response regulator transcription factor [Lacipirellulaceae bacterium]|nr:response regulator transcription factor [Lacipirellulaceae bacterium]
MKDAIFVALIGLNTIQGEGLVSILRKGGFSHVRSYSSVAELPKARLPANRRIVWLIDVRKVMSDLPEVVGKLRTEHPKSSIALLADASDHAIIMQAAECGVDGLLSDKIGREVMIKSLELIVLGEKVFPATSLLQMCKRNSEVVVNHLDASTRLHMLSSREAEVLQKLMDGYPNKVIARHCGITEATVKVHVKAILRKIQAKNRIQAAVWARKYGIGVPSHFDSPKLLPSISALPLREIQSTDNNLSIQPDKLSNIPKRQHNGSKT